MEVHRCIKSIPYVIINRFLESSFSTSELKTECPEFEDFGDKAFSAPSLFEQSTPVNWMVHVEPDTYLSSSCTNANLTDLTGSLR